MTQYLTDALFLVGDDENYIDEFRIRDRKLDQRRVHAGYWIPLEEFIRDNYSVG